MLVNNQIRVVLALGAFLFLTAAPALADDCADLSDDAAIAACTQEINSGQLVGSDLLAVYTNRGQEYENKGEHDRAIADYNKAIELLPKFVPPYSNRGIAYEQRGDKVLAIADYKMAQSFDQKDADSAPALADDCADLSGDAAIAACTQEINSGQLVGSELSAVYDRRGVAYNDKGDNDRAIADYTKAIELDPNNVVAVDNLSTALVDKGE